MAIFGVFQFYHVTSNGHISAIFYKYGLKFFLEPPNMLHLQKRKENWGTLTFKCCFKVNELKNMIFLGRFLVFGAKFSYEAV